jgi:hypothetical protein
MQAGPILPAVLVSVLEAQGRIQHSEYAASLNLALAHHLPVAHVERRIFKEVETAMLARLLDSMPSIRRKDALLGAGTADAGAWLDAAGSRDSGTRLEDVDYVQAGRLRLGLPLVRRTNAHNADAPWLCKYCSAHGTQVLHSLDHAFLCPKSKGHITTRHNRARDAVYACAKGLDADPAISLYWEPDMVTKLGYQRLPNSKGKIDPKERRADMYVGFKGKDGNEVKLVVDFTGTHPGATKGCKATADLPGPASAPGFAAEAGASKKVKTYTSRFNIPSQEVVPVSFETNGRLCERGRLFFSELTRLVFNGQSTNPHVRTRVRYSAIRRQLSERASCAIQRGNAWLVRCYLARAQAEA